MLNKALYSFNKLCTNTTYIDQNTKDNKIFGLWIYLMSDCILFAVLFATYAVLKSNLTSTIVSKEIFKLKPILIETFFILFSNIAYNMVIPSMYKNNKKHVNFWLSLTFLFGLSFIFMEFYELNNLINMGYSPDYNAFFSSFFTLLVTHGLHVIFGLIWILVMICQVHYCDLHQINQVRLHCLNLFWHFLDIIWICIFTIIYLIGVL